MDPEFGQAGALRCFSRSPEDFGYPPPQQQIPLASRLIERLFHARLLCGKSKLTRAGVACCDLLLLGQAIHHEHDKMFTNIFYIK
jgi:hypothetical protein